MNWRWLIDQGLELTVVGSFSRVGYAVRRWLYAWSTPAPGALDRRTVLVTGPTSGLGRAATDELAALGARVILVGRSEERLAAVRAALVSRHGADRFPTVVADMGSLRSIAEAVATIRAREPRLDVVVDNAGAIVPTRTVGPDGIEAMFATLVVGPLALSPACCRFLGSPRALESLRSRRVACTTTAGSGRPRIARRALLRDPRLRSSQARAGGTGTRMGAQVGAGGHHLQRHASRVGGYAGPRGVVAGIPSAAGADPPDPGRRSRHARLAGRRIRSRGRERGPLPRPPPTAVDKVPMTRLRAPERRRLWDLVVDLSRETEPEPDA